MRGPAAAESLPSPRVRREPEALKKLEEIVLAQACEIATTAGAVARMVQMLDGKILTLSVSDADCADEALKVNPKAGG